MREPVGGADDEGLEGVLGVEPRLERRRLRRPGSAAGAGRWARAPAGRATRAERTGRPGRRRRAGSARPVVRAEAPARSGDREAGPSGRLSTVVRSICRSGGRRPSVGAVLRRGGAVGVGEGGLTVTAIWISRPKTSVRASSTWPRSRPSSWLRVNSSGTSMIAVEPCSVTGRLDRSQARWLGCSRRPPRARTLGRARGRAWSTGVVLPVRRRLSGVSGLRGVSSHTFFHRL